MRSGMWTKVLAFLTVISPSSERCTATCTTEDQCGVA